MVENVDIKKKKEPEISSFEYLFRFLRMSRFTMKFPIFSFSLGQISPLSSVADKVSLPIFLLCVGGFDVDLEYTLSSRLYWFASFSLYWGKWTISVL